MSNNMMNELGARRNIVNKSAQEIRLKFLVPNFPYCLARRSASGCSRCQQKETTTTCIWVEKVNKLYQNPDHMLWILESIEDGFLCVAIMLVLQYYTVNCTTRIVILLQINKLCCRKLDTIIMFDLREILQTYLLSLPYRSQISKSLPCIYQHLALMAVFQLIKNQ